MGIGRWGFGSNNYKNHVIPNSKCSYSFFPKDTYYYNNNIIIIIISFYYKNYIMEKL